MQTLTEDFSREVLAFLPPDYPWADRFIWLAETDSTNSVLKRLAPTGIPAGTAVCAGHQTGGRGRMGRSFLSPPDMGIYLSMLLRPKCSAGDLMHLTCAAAVSVCDAVEKTAGFRPGIKWTNDLVYGKRKLCGILTELGLQPDGSVDYAIVGVGINCRQKLTDFPPELRDKAGSLEMVTGKEVSRPRLAAEMLTALYRMQDGLLGDKEAILEQYRADCVTLGKEVSLVRGSSVRYGKALDVSDTGALIVEFSPGQVEAVDSGEASVRGMYGYIG